MTGNSASRNTLLCAYLHTATNFCDAGDELLRIAKKRKVSLMIGKYSKPIQFLYFHAIESSLKAFLGLLNQPIPKGHDIAKYYAQCRALGLPQDRRLDSHNAVAGLANANEQHRLRYFVLGSYSQPSMRMAKTGTRFILRAVARDFERRGVRQEKLGKNSMVIMTFETSRIRD
jgi:hypothetical protein